MWRSAVKARRRLVPRAHSAYVRGMASDKPAPDKAESDRPPAPKTTTKPKLIEQAPGEVGGPEGPEPTRYGDWEKNGRVSDF